MTMMTTTQMQQLHWITISRNSRLQLTMFYKHFHWWRHSMKSGRLSLLLCIRSTISKHIMCRDVEHPDDTATAEMTRASKTLSNQQNLVLGDSSCKCHFAHSNKISRSEEKPPNVVLMLCASVLNHKLRSQAIIQGLRALRIL